MNREAERKRLVELTGKHIREELGMNLHTDILEKFADHLLDNGVKVTPFVAMVEQVLINGKLDNRATKHNGKYAVVYIDKTKWNCPLIDITEQYYNNEKALERIKALEGSGEK